MGLSGTEMLLKQVCNVMGLKPEDIQNSIQSFQHTVKTVNERQGRIEDGQVRLENMLTDVLANQRTIISIMQQSNPDIAPAHASLILDKQLELTSGDETTDKELFLSHI